MVSTEDTPLLLERFSTECLRFSASARWVSVESASSSSTRASVRVAAASVARRSTAVHPWSVGHKQGDNGASAWAHRVQAIQPALLSYSTPKIFNKTEPSQTELHGT